MVIMYNVNRSSFEFSFQKIDSRPVQLMEGVYNS